MKIKDKDVNISEAIAFSNQEELLYKHYKNNIFLNDYQVNILRKNGFNYSEYGSMQELLFDIEEYLSNEFDDELDLVSNQIAELIYYRDTKK